MNKDTYVYSVQGNYGCGWEEVFECETEPEAENMLKCYDDNEYMYPHRIKKIRKTT